MVHHLAMKRTQKCPKCGHDRILYVSEVPDSRSTEPMRIARIKRQVASVLGMQAVTFDAVGELEAGVCAACGYVELYVKDPSSIPVDGSSVREIIGAG